jgi:HK97 family phage prohead protease
VKRLCTLEQFAADANAQRDVGSTAIATQLVGIPEISEGDRTIRYRFSTPEVGRDMHTVAANAWQLKNFLRNPVFLWAHDDSQPPIGRVIEIGTVDDELRGTVEYADRDLNPFADLIYRLVRAKYLNATSTSWQPLEWSMSRDRNRQGGLDFTKVDLLEISQVPIPALPDALADARRSLGVDTSPLYRWAERMLDGEGLTVLPREELESLRRAARMKPNQRAAANWEVGVPKDLPIEDDDSWDGSVAETSIFEFAGGDSFEPAKARKGFLVYNSSDDTKRSAYKLPLAHAVDGELKVPKGAIRAALSRISETDIPEDVKERAEAMLQEYAKRAGIGEEEDDEEKERAAAAERTRVTAVAEQERAAAAAAATAAAAEQERQRRAAEDAEDQRRRAARRNARRLTFRRGLYECGQLGYLLMQLGFMHDQSKLEEALEADADSSLPEMLGEALKMASEAFLAMAQEEVEELLEQIEGGDEEVPEAERAFVTRAENPRIRALRRGVAIMRAGKALSSANQEKLAGADRHCDRALRHHQAQTEHQQAVSDNVEELRGLHRRATSTLSELGYDNHKVTRAMGDMSERIEELADSHEDAKDSHSMIGRSVRGCQRCLRAVSDGSATEEDDDKQDDNSRAARLERVRKLRAVI